MPIPSAQIYYCRIRNCQRNCGLVHRDSSRKRFPFSSKCLSLDSMEPEKESSKKTRKPRDQKSRPKKSGKENLTTVVSLRSKSSIGTSASTSNASSGRVSQNTDVKRTAEKQRQFSTFEEIMDRAAKKISTVTIEDKPSVSALPKEETLAEKRSHIVPSVSVDTTTIHFDQPVWDNPELRAELLESEEEFALDASPPTLQEDSLAVDEIIYEATHAVDSNPIDHERKDEMLSGWSSDENDFSTLDLRQIHRLDSQKSLEYPVRKQILRGGSYEQSIDIADNV